MTIHWYNNQGILIDSFWPSTFSEAVRKAKDWSSLAGFVFINAFYEGRKTWFYSRGKCASEQVSQFQSMTGADEFST